MLPAGHSSIQVSSVITITGLGDHDQPEWLITMTGIRTRRDPKCRFPRLITRKLSCWSAVTRRRVAGVE
jgi:hypothetical protein